MSFSRTHRTIATLAAATALVALSAPAQADQYPSDGVNCPDASWHGGLTVSYKGHMSFQVRNGAGVSKVWHLFYDGGDGGMQSVYRGAPTVTGLYIYANGWPTKGYSGTYADSVGLTALCVA